jgi:hypothetical protein
VVTKAPGVESRYQVSYDSAYVHLRKEYRTLAPQVEVEDLAEYAAALEETRLTLGDYVPEYGSSRRAKLDSPSPTSALLLLLLLASLGAHNLWARIRDFRARLR